MNYRHRVFFWGHWFRKAVKFGFQPHSSPINTNFSLNKSKLFICKRTWKSNSESWNPSNWYLDSMILAFESFKKCNTKVISVIEKFKKYKTKIVVSMNRGVRGKIPGMSRWKYSKKGPMMNSTPFVCLSRRDQKHTKNFTFSSLRLLLIYREVSWPRQ